jgi:hypothetical protein
MWSQSAILYAPGYETGKVIDTLFGNSVAIYEDVIAVGASYDYFGDGAVYIFEGGYSTGHWTNTQKLYGDVSEGLFGTHVQIYDDCMAISSPYHRDIHIDIHGYRSAVFLYMRGNTRKWELKSTVYSNYYRGYIQNIAIHQNRLAVQWKSKDSVFIYDFDSSADIITYYHSKINVQARKFIFGDLSTLYLSLVTRHHDTIGVYNYNNKKWNYVSTIAYSNHHGSHSSALIAVYDHKLFVQYKVIYENDSDNNSSTNSHYEVREFSIEGTTNGDIHATNSNNYYDDNGFTNMATGMAK